MPENNNDSLSLELTNKITERWVGLTAKQEEERPRTPLRILLGEARDLVGAVENHFDDFTLDGNVVLGLNSVVSKGTISSETATEIRELHCAITATHSAYLNRTDDTSDAPTARADEILGELRSALGFLLDDGEHEAGEAKLARLREEYSEEGSHDAIAMTLDGYARLASEYRKELVAFGGFEPSWIDEGIRVADALWQRSSDKMNGKAPQVEDELMSQRNRLLGALMDRVRDVRRSGRYVFRAHPKILQKFVSEHSRDQRRARRKKNNAVATAANPMTKHTAHGAEGLAIAMGGAS